MSVQNIIIRGKDQIKYYITYTTVFYYKIAEKMHYKSYNSKQLSLILKSLDKARNTTRVLAVTFHVYFKSFTNRIGGMMVRCLSRVG